MSDLLHTVCTDLEFRALDKEDDFVRQFIASDGSVDSHNTKLNPNGWDLRKYTRNGPFFWAHNRHLPPIGKAVRVWVEKDKLKAQIKFVGPEHDHPMGKSFGHSVMRLYDEGFMKAVSVGFNPIEQEPSPRRKDKGWRKAIDILQQELVEISAVPIGSNANALKQAKTRGINTDPIFCWLEALRDDPAVQDPIVTRAMAVDILDSNAGSVVMVQGADLEPMEPEQRAEEEVDDPKLSMHTMVQSTVEEYTRAKETMMKRALEGLEHAEALLDAIDTVDDTTRASVERIAERARQLLGEPQEEPQENAQIEVCEPLDSRADDDTMTPEEFQRAIEAAMKVFK